MWKNKRQGRCRLCGKRDLVERHHVLYRPERTLDLCHSCHFNTHYKPWLLKENQLFILLNAKLKGDETNRFLKSQEQIKKEIQEYAHTLSLLAQKRQPIPIVAPSRQGEGFTKPASNALNHGFTPREVKVRAESRDGMKENYNLRNKRKEKEKEGGEIESKRESEREGD